MGLGLGLGLGPGLGLGLGLESGLGLLERALDVTLGAVELAVEDVVRLVG